MTIVNRMKIPIDLPLESVVCYYVEDSVPTLIAAGVNRCEGVDDLRPSLEGKVEEWRMWVE